MSVFTGEPSYMLIASRHAHPPIPSYPPSTIFVDLAITKPLCPRGDVIHTAIPLQPLKQLAPALLNYLTIDGSRILLPRSDALDIPLLNNLVDLVVSQHRTTGSFDLDFSAVPQQPVKMVKLHVLLTLFGMGELADELAEHLWMVFGSCTLTLADVMWMWIVLGPEGKRGGRWVPGAEEVYRQMLAWGVLNARVQGRVDEDLKVFLEDVERDRKVCYLTSLLERRFRQYGLGREILASASQHRTREDAVMDRDGGNNGSAGEPACGPPSSSQSQAAVSTSVPLGCSYDECEAENKVKVMAAQRDELLRTRQLEVLGKLKDPKDTPQAFQEFGYPGWCESKGKPGQR